MCAQVPSSEVDPARGSVGPSSEEDPARGSVGPSGEAGRPRERLALKRGEPHPRGHPPCHPCGPRGPPGL
jgi:hypothetical protein